MLNLNKEKNYLEVHYVAEKQHLKNEFGIIEMSKLIPYHGVQFGDHIFNFKNFSYEILSRNYGIDKCLEFDNVFENIILNTEHINTYGSAYLDEFYVNGTHIIGGIPQLNSNFSIDLIDFEKLLKELGVRRYSMIIPSEIFISDKSKFKIIHENKNFKNKSFNIIQYEDMNEKIIIPNKLRTCCKCGELFYLNNNDIEFFKTRKLSLPKKCKKCRGKSEG